MKMVLQFQTVNQNNNGTYSGDANYLTELLYEQTSFADAKQAVQDVLSPVYKTGKIQMTIDGNSGKWGCTFHFSEAAAPLPLSFGADLDSPDAIYEYYIDYVWRIINERNALRDANGDYLYDEVKDILGIYEYDDYLSIHVLFDDDEEGSVDMPYPHK